MAVSKRRQFSAEKGICHMSEDTIAKLPDPSGISPDPLTDVIRSGARKLIEQAIEAELATLLAPSPGTSSRTAARGWCVTVICRSAT
jgi:putative transposase